jgi:hypothetical protein
MLLFGWVMDISTGIIPSGLRAEERALKEAGAITRDLRIN